ncbi:MAG TPA: alpha/beta hydrolase [Cyanobacteria bacterium UBA8803]|nr:alpha/beta hydrolase [Cyanobacteria bacterium UBA9273]HBL62763.1 alpha/beta hydrolase [Cyanobacteria bacterium UBA8803]
MNASRKFLTITGSLALAILAGIIIILVALHWLGLINAWLFPFKPVIAMLISVSLSCLILAQIRQEPKQQNQKSLKPQRRKKPKRRWPNRLLSLLITLLILFNIPTYFLAYHMTHVRIAGQPGIGIPKPRNSSIPSDRGLPYITHKIPVTQSEWLETWLIPSQTSSSKGTVFLFPGNRGTKGSQLLAPAQSFTSFGYDSLLVDFQGVGGSSGNKTTIGIKEAQDVVTALRYSQQLNLKPPFILYGVSMGSAAILRAISVNGIKPDAIILELPFARILDAVKSRLKYYRIPPFIRAELLIFWAGVQHGVNGFTHNPIDFAHDVNCPALVIHGEQDKWTTVAEIKALFQNLKSPKQLIISPDVGHQQLIGIHRSLWNSTLKKFLNSL